LSGAWSLRYSDLERYFFYTDAANIGQNNQYYYLGGGRYGKYKIDIAIPNGGIDNFDTVDDSKLHALDIRFRYNFYEGYYFTLGYHGERFDYDDYDKQGFTTIPTNAAGAYNGVLLSDSLWEPYNAYFVYTNFAVEF
jgi:hypothetical protein